MALQPEESDAEPSAQAKLARFLLDEFKGPGQASLVWLLVSERFAPTSLFGIVTYAYCISWCFDVF